MLRHGIFSSALGISLSLLVACGGGGGGSGSPLTGSGGSGGTATGGTNNGGSQPASSDAALTDSVAEVPIAGQILATCLVDGTALIESFVPSDALPATPVDAPTLDDVLAMADAGGIPVIGGFEPLMILGTFVAVDVESTIAMIGAGGLSMDLPVIGTAPITCSDVAETVGDLPLPTEAVGLVPVFDSNGDPIAVVIATVSSLASEAPAVNAVTLPDAESLLPNLLGSTIGSLL